MDLTLEYTHERYQFGKPIATMQLMQGKLAGELSSSPPLREEGKLIIPDMYTKLSASRAYTYAVARACDQGDVSRQVSLNPDIWGKAE